MPGKKISHDAFCSLSSSVISSFSCSLTVGSFIADVVVFRGSPPLGSCQHGWALLTCPTGVIVRPFLIYHSLHSLMWTNHTTPKRSPSSPQPSPQTWCNSPGVWLCVWLLGYGGVFMNVGSRLITVLKEWGGLKHALNDMIISKITKWKSDKPKGSLVGLHCYCLCIYVGLGFEPSSSWIGATWI